MDSLEDPWAINLNTSVGRRMELSMIRTRAYHALAHRSVGSHGWPFLRRGDSFSSGSVLRLVQPDMSVAASH